MWTKTQYMGRSRKFDHTPLWGGKDNNIFPPVVSKQLFRIAPDHVRPEK
jgi:hypothetical protein